MLRAGDAVWPGPAAPATPAPAAVPFAAVSGAPAGGVAPLPATPGGDGGSAEDDGYAGTSARSTLASLAANCSHITAEAALRNASASFASARTLPLRDAWCVDPRTRLGPGWLLEGDGRDPAACACAPVSHAGSAFS